MFNDLIRMFIWKDHLRVSIELFKIHWYSQLIIFQSCVIQPYVSCIHLKVFRILCSGLRQVCSYSSTEINLLRFSLRICFVG